MSVAVTGLYAGTLGIVFLIISRRVLNNRVRPQANLLDGGDEALTRAMRVHGNFAEYVPFALMLMALAEIQDGSGLFRHVMGTVLIVCRLCHAYAITATSGPNPAPLIGFVGTAGVIIAAGGYSIYRFADAAVELVAVERQKEALTTCFENGYLKIAASLPLANALVEEFANFRAK